MANRRQQPEEPRQETTPWAKMSTDERTVYLQQHFGDRMWFVYKPYEEPRRAVFKSHLETTVFHGTLLSLVLVGWRLGEPGQSEHAGIHVELDKDDAKTLGFGSGIFEDAITVDLKWSDIDELTFHPTRERP